jgi:alpha-tubulin suppressor-like RCC1 family protein
MFSQVVTSDNEVFAAGCNERGQCALPGQPVPLTPLPTDTDVAASATESNRATWSAAVAPGKAGDEGMEDVSDLPPPDVTRNFTYSQPEDVYRFSRIDSLATIHVSTVACGDAHSLAVTNTGSVYTWGANDFGQLGLGHAGTVEMHIHCF